MTAKFIDLVTPEPGDDQPRAHSLQLQGDLLCTLGNIPHGHAWRPNTRNDRDRLVAFLMTIDYAEG